MGLGPLRDIYLNVTRGGDLNLALWSPALRGRIDGDPARAVITGFPWHDRHAQQEHPSHEVESFLDECNRANDPPVLFSLGTAAVHVAGRFYDDAARACRALGRRGVLLVGRGPSRPGDLPAGVRVFTYAPFSSVMPRCAASVHHGGIGTTGQALRSGRPQLLVPHAHDQFDNAARCERLGVGLRLNRTRCDAPSMARALGGLLASSDAARAAAAVGERVRAEDGAARAADRLEAIARA
jgi:UDP:flavonoid glycosyltransferase YjiC (YdhE family)